MGALLHLDAELRTDHAARFLTTDGLWHQWIDGPPHKKHRDTPADCREDISPLGAFAEESAEHRPGRETMASPRLPVIPIHRTGDVRELRATVADYSRPPVIHMRDIASARAGYRAASQSISESTSNPCAVLRASRF